MKTIQLRLETDPEMPEFQRLQYEIVEVPLREILENGVHPWDRESDYKPLLVRFVKEINRDDLKYPDLKEFGYCPEIVDSSRYYSFSGNPYFEETLQAIRQRVYFADRLTLRELVSMAKERLNRIWNHEQAKELAKARYPTFDPLRTFLKSKDKTLKLSGYGDLDKYDLSKIVGVADFENEEKLLIEHGLPSHNFRSTRFLVRMTDERGYLKQGELIRHFEITVNPGEWREHRSVVYRCEYAKGIVRFIPELQKYECQRQVALKFARTWRTDDGCLCFACTLETVETMLQKENIKIEFVGLIREEGSKPPVASGELATIRIPQYAVTRYLTQKTAGDVMRKILRQEGVSMSGRKEELGKKLVTLAVQRYHAKESQLESYFRTNRFIRKPPADKEIVLPFPLLQDDELDRLVLAMYITRHLRANTILDVNHENQTYSLDDLACALINQTLQLEGAFLRVE